MLNAPRFRTTRTIRTATVATAAAATLTFGAAAAAIAPQATANPGEVRECVSEITPERTADAISRAISTGDIAAGHDWAPNKAMEYLGGDCDEVTAQPVSARGGDPSAPTALLLFRPGSGEYARAAEIPGFVAEGPAWGAQTSGMVHIERTARDVIRVKWANEAGATATVDYRYVHGPDGPPRYEFELVDGTGHN
ncbi:hypothetical protein ACFWGD_02105 [Corynebacterium sp. NPDC060344]|uniref:hypothetical protein n=1 Tax=Corynebacterium sp. NPDC060344 TaxID=3347101 RepID=UPI00365DB30B